MDSKNVSLVFLSLSVMVQSFSWTSGDHFSLWFTDEDFQLRSILVTASCDHAARIWPDCILYARSDFVDFTLSKKVQIIMCKTDLDLIWMAWSGFGQTHLVWKPTGVQESSGSVLAECNQPAASFALSDSVAFFHRCPEPYYCTKPARIWFGSGWLC